MVCFFGMDSLVCPGTLEKLFVSIAFLGIPRLYQIEVLSRI